MTVDPGLEAALAGPFLRVSRVLDGQGRKLWLKRVERLGLRMRLQKGDPQQGFEAERRALKHLAALGLPVVPMVAEGSDWFATLDCGATMDRALADPLAREEARRAMLDAAARSLVALHGQGLAHGRPVLRDICWDGAEARFIDLERCRLVTGRRWAMALDMAMLVQSWFSDFADAPTGPMDAGFAVWKRAAPQAVVFRLRLLGWVLLPLDPLARLVLLLRPKAREFRALPLALAYLRRSAR